MKPHRLALTHSLVLNYGLYKKMEVSHAHLGASLVGGANSFVNRSTDHTVPRPMICADSMLRTT